MRSFCIERCHIGRCHIGLTNGRVEKLKEKMIQRIRPFVEAKHPGDINDPETKAFEAKIREEAEDLKLESFGIEVSPFYRA